MTALEKLRVMGLDEYKKHCLELAIRLIEMVKMVADQALTFDDGFFHGEHHKEIVRFVEHIKDALGPTKDDRVASVRFCGSGRPCIHLDFPGGYDEIVEIHKVVWNRIEIGGLLSDEDKELLELVWVKCELDQAIPKYEDARARLSSYGVDLETPRIW